MCLRITTIYKKNDKKFSEVENIYFHALQFNRSQVYQLEIYKNITFLFQIFKRFYNRFEKKKSIVTADVRVSNSNSKFDTKIHKKFLPLNPSLC